MNPNQNINEQMQSIRHYLIASKRRIDAISKDPIFGGIMPEIMQVEDIKCRAFTTQYLDALRGNEEQKRTFINEMQPVLEYAKREWGYRGPQL